MPTYPRIPYGWADFEAIRLERRLYVDKTRFIRELEEERYAFLIRPRRFGKSCWVSLLEHYYDRNRTDRFETLFAGTDIWRSPTRNRHRYVILRFDFSVVNDTLETLEREFEIYCEMELRDALERNPDLFPVEAARRILAPPSIDAKLNELFRHARRRGIPLYVLIDEYDNFANTVLAHRGAEAYQSLTHGGGFYRNFFAALKGATGRSGGGLERLFITGVSPITMDDVTSGFNIGTNISLKRKFNEMLGFTDPEVRGLLTMYREHGAFNQDVDTALDLMREWYDGYRFSATAEASVYNTDMVLYYLRESLPNEPVPDEMIDTNVRIDYGKLRHLLVVNRQLNGNFDLLRNIIGEETADGPVQTGFPLDRLDQRENFLSLLFYFGLLSMRGGAEGVPRLAIPNQTVKRLMYGYLRDAYRDVGAFSIDLYAFGRLTHEMGFRGAWRPVMDFLRGAISRQTGIRDYIDGEKVVQGFLAAYLNVTDYFLFHSQYELGKGYADICLEPFLVRYPGLRFGYVIELKYLKRSERGQRSESAAEPGVAAAIREATAQLRRYLADESLARRYPSVRFVGLAVVFRGWEMVSCEAVHGPD